jgi:plastocyanin domain-containing protein
MKKKLIILAAVCLVAYGLVALIRWDPNADTAGTSENVTIRNGTQYIDITAKGGYAPRKTLAQAGLPTVLKVVTNGTYDCSSAITIPDQGVNQYLPPSGTTDIALGTPAVGTLQGTCSMGMYQFEIDFAS